MRTGIDGFIVAKELKWKAKLRHWLGKRQNTMSMPQWCPEPSLKKQLAGKLKDYRKSPKVAILALSHVMKSDTYKHKNHKFRVFRQSLE
ncbi:MAG: hypothetical protein BBJ57_06940 [Desulfobacterales bacterium PC51MH44]|nr:MAG: hypothetical protein BBJ57_06940 [Desulfobacterales bacterium PC51MH44]